MTQTFFVGDVKRLSAKKVLLNWQTNVKHPPVTIYVGEKADLSLENKTKLGSTTDGSIELDIENNLRCYFVLEIAGKYYITAERILPLEGANNFRDIGGYLNEDGRQVKWGNFYRSDHLHNLTDKDIAYLKTTHIHSIIDYRNEKEYSKQPNRIWEDKLNQLNLIPEASSAELAAKAGNDHDKIQELIELSQSKDSSVTIDGSGYIMEEQNRDFVRNTDTAKVYRELIDLILDTKNVPMVQHCRGGKDRTGFGVAIILAILDVNHDLILQDYMMTEKLRYNRNMRRMNEYKNETTNPDVLAFLYSMMESRASYLSAAFGEMEKHYGSVHGYLEKALKINDNEKMQIKRDYLY